MLGHLGCLRVIMAFPVPFCLLRNKIKRLVREETFTEHRQHLELKELEGLVCIISTWTGKVLQVLKNFTFNKISLGGQDAHDLSVICHHQKILLFHSLGSAGFTPSFCLNYQSSKIHSAVSSPLLLMVLNMHTGRLSSSVLRNRTIQLPIPFRKVRRSLILTMVFL